MINRKLLLDPDYVWNRRNAVIACVWFNFIRMGMVWYGMDLVACR